MAGTAIYPSLHERVVFVSGGAQGIGAAIVEAFARQGARVAFVDLAEERATALCDMLAEEGRPKPWFRRCDVTDTKALQQAVRDAAEAFGPVRVLVNNAAHDERHDWKAVTEEYWDNRIAVNLRHQFFATQAAAPMMQKAGGGSIINFGSMSWHAGQGGMPAYTASKAGIEALTRSFARDLGPDNIRVNCVIPGWIMTERQLEMWMTPEAGAELDRMQCLKQRLVPDDVARMVLWLAADDSDGCTSQMWTVDAGRL